VREGEGGREKDIFTIRFTMRNLFFKGENGGLPKPCVLTFAKKKNSRLLPEPVFYCTVEFLRFKKKRTHF
jgi:hypothetical protein